MGWAEALEAQGWACLPDRLPSSSLEDLVGRLPMLATPSRRPVPLGPLAAWLPGTGLPEAVASLLGEDDR